MDKIIAIFNENKVRYLLIGGQAVRLHGFPRFSMDWDFYIPGKDLANIKKINALLECELDMPLLPLGKNGEYFVQTYQTSHGILQFHLAGLGLPKFEDAEQNSVTIKTEADTAVNCVSVVDLLASKTAANRPEDQADIRFLKKKAAL